MPILFSNARKQDHRRPQDRVAGQRPCSAPATNLPLASSSLSSGFTLSGLTLFLQITCSYLIRI
ncbi:hypothetical protein Hanom_Chr15g01402121 [Helianthus anomalus]